MRIEDAQSGAPVWSEDFTRPDTAVAGLPDEVAAKLTDILEIAEYARTSHPPLTDDAALSALLAAHSLIREDRRESWAQILDLAQRPVAAAPDFALAIDGQVARLLRRAPGLPYDCKTEATKVASASPTAKSRA